jgi:hypothetical protein
VAASYSNSTGLDVYLDGAVDGTDISNGDLRVAITDDFGVGNLSISMDSVLDGMVDEPRLYNAVLSEARIAHTCNALKPATFWDVGDDTPVDAGEPEVTVVATDATGTEASTTTFAFTITLSEAAAGDIDVIVTETGTATITTDYTLATSTMNCTKNSNTSWKFTAGLTSCVVTGTPVDDSLYDIGETVIFTAVSGTGYTVVADPDDHGTATITDNDEAGAVGSYPSSVEPRISRMAAFSTTGPSTAVNVTGVGATMHQVVWYLRGTASACTIKIQKSSDNVNWSDVVSGDCTSPGKSAITVGVAAYVRLNLTVFTPTSYPAEVTGVLLSMSEAGIYSSP